MRQIEELAVTLPPSRRKALASLGSGRLFFRRRSYYQAKGGARITGQNADALMREKLATIQRWENARFFGEALVITRRGRTLLEMLETTDPQKETA